MPEVSESTDIAIIGMAGRFPGAATVDAFWSNLCNGTEAITHFTDEELLHAGVAPAVLHGPNYVKAGAILDDDIGLFDAAFFGLTPQDARVMDPQQRLFLESVWNALENAGYYPENYPGTISLFGGSGMSTYLLNNIYPNTDVLEAVGPLQIALSNDKDSLTTRVAYLLNLTGPCYTVQTYCSTSLVAVCIACSSLRNYECDMALAGGVALSVPQKVGYSYQEGGIASPDARCRAFDARANGSPLGNGVGVVVLKRLEDALQDGDTIHAVIKGSAMNNDGSLKVGYTAPGVRGQTRVILEALANADVPAESISYIEAHGTGTPLGDAAELTALVKAFQTLTKKKHFCAIGSVKTNIGHLDRAAGVTGLLKTVLALKHKLIPASLNYHEPNPQVNLHDSPFYVNTQLTEWASDCTPRRAGVSSFGIGGTNAHVIVEEAPTVTPTASCQSHQLLVLSARSKGALEVAIKNLKDYLQEHPELPLADVAYTLQIGRKAFEYRFAVVCRNHEEALDKLTTPATDHLPSGTQPATEHTLALLKQEEDISEALLNTLGQLWVAGTQVDWTSFTAQERRQRVPLPTYPFEHQRYWIEGRKPFPNTVQTSTDERVGTRTGAVGTGLAPVPTRSSTFSPSLNSIEPPDLSSATVTARLENLQREDLPQWFYLPGWKQSLPSLPTDRRRFQKPGQCWLIFTDKCGIGHALQRQLEHYDQDVIVVLPGQTFAKLGPTSYAINPKGASDYESLLKDILASFRTPTRIIHAWSVTADPVSNLSDSMEQGLFSLMYLAQALGNRDLNPCKITVISSDLHEITGNELIQPEKATILGGCRVIPLEYPQITCQNVDISFEDLDTRQDTLLTHLIAELLRETSEPVVALRSRQRWVESFEPITLPSVQHTNSAPLREGGVYLITGGLGGIGMAMAEHLAKLVHARLALIARASLPPRERWSDPTLQGADADITRKIQQVQRLEELGSEVLLLSADVANEEQMRSALEQVIARLGALHGVIHAAGVPGIGLMQMKTAEQVDQVLTPKVMGTLVLDRLLNSHDLDFLVLFSSITAITGGLGQIDYCAANAFLDAFAHRNATRHGRTIAVDWGEWQWNAWEAGLSGYDTELQNFLKQNRQRVGIDFDEGFEALTRILVHPLPQVIVSPQHFPSLVEISKVFTTATLAQQTRASGTKRATHVRPSLANAYVAPDNEVQQAIARLWEECLGIEGIGIHDNFFVLGGHSLVGTQLISRIRRQFDIHLPIAALFESPTIAELALMVELALVEEIEQLDNVQL